MSIRGSDPPTGSGAAVQWNKFAEFLPTRKAVDASGGGNSSNGDAIVVHYRAAQVLIENLRLWNACTGLSIGRSEAVVRDVTVRRVLMFGLRYGQASSDGTAADGERCKGRGIPVTNATHLDFYHLTLDDVPSQAVLLSADAGPVSDVDLWNSVLRLRAQAGAAQQWVALAAGMPWTRSTATTTCSGTPMRSPRVGASPTAASRSTWPPGGRTGGTRTEPTPRLAPRGPAVCRQPAGERLPRRPGLARPRRRARQHRIAILRGVSGYRIPRVLQLTGYATPPLQVHRPQKTAHPTAPFAA